MSHTSLPVLWIDPRLSADQAIRRFAPHPALRFIRRLFHLGEAPLTPDLVHLPALSLRTDPETPPGIRDLAVLVDGFSRTVRLTRHADWNAAPDPTRNAAFPFPLTETESLLLARESLRAWSVQRLLGQRPPPPDAFRPHALVQYPYWAVLQARRSRIRARLADGLTGRPAGPLLRAGYFAALTAAARTSGRRPAGQRPE